METTDQSRINFLLRGSIVGGIGGATVLAQTQQAQAIDIAEVNTAMTSIATNADGVADVAFPIGAALVALTLIAMVLKRFIMVA